MIVALFFLLKNCFRPLLIVFSYFWCLSRKPHHIDLIVQTDSPWLYDEQAGC